MHEHGAQVLVAVNEVVLAVVALVFEGIEGFVFDVPAGAGTSQQRHEMVCGDRDIRHPRKVLHPPVGGLLSVFEKIDFEFKVGRIQRRAIQVAEAVALALRVGEADLGGRRRSHHPVAQQGVVARFGAEHETQIEHLQQAEVRGIGSQGVFDDDPLQMRMLAAQIAQRL